MAKRKRTIIREVGAEQRLVLIAEILESVDRRCSAADGGVTKTRHEITDEELKTIYTLTQNVPRAAALTGPDVPAPTRTSLADKAKQEMSEFDKEYPHGAGATGHVEGFLVSTPVTIFEEHPGGTMVARAASASQTIGQPCGLCEGPCTGKHDGRAGSATGPDVPAPSEKCNAPAASFIPRWGMSHACVLPKDHEGEHKQGGDCFKHGPYVGESCPKFPDCLPERAASASQTVEHAGHVLNLDTERCSCGRWVTNANLAKSTVEQHAEHVASVTKGRQPAEL
jgi:hypothetical protein